MAVAEKKKIRTAFTTRFGLYGFNELMERVPHGLKCKIFIVVFSEIVVVLLSHLEQIFQKLRDAVRVSN